MELGKFKFEKLQIWKIAMDFGEDIDAIAYTFPKHEIYNLCSQIRRASDSIALNISEGSIGQSNPEQNKFIGYAIRSLSEVITCLFKARRRKYISNDEFLKHYLKCFELMNKMIAFRKTLK